MSYLEFLLLSLIGFVAGAMSATAVVSISSPEPVTVYLDPASGTHQVGDTFTLAIKVKSAVPVNVFSGELDFDPHALHIEKIDYNTSIANLWAEKPWYENGAGTMNFAGGTTKKGGFTGDDTLITITFMSDAIGQTAISLNNLRVLRDDGLGTDASVAAPIDALFTVPSTTLQAETVATPVASTHHVTVTPTENSIDLNGDGKETLADVSIFMQYLATGDLRADFNGDGKVSVSDLSRLLQKL